MPSITAAAAPAAAVPTTATAASADTSSAAWDSHQIHRNDIVAKNEFSAASSDDSDSNRKGPVTLCGKKLRSSPIKLVLAEQCNYGNYRMMCICMSCITTSQTIRRCIIIIAEFIYVYVYAAISASCASRIAEWRIDPRQKRNRQELGHELSNYRFPEFLFARRIDVVGVTAAAACVATMFSASPAMYAWEYQRSHCNKLITCGPIHEIAHTNQDTKISHKEIINGQNILLFVEIFVLVLLLSAQRRNPSFLFPFPFCSWRSCCSPIPCIICTTWKKATNARNETN